MKIIYNSIFSKNNGTPVPARKEKEEKPSYVLNEMAVINGLSKQRKNALDKVRSQEREMKLRESEDKRIESIRSLIDKTLNSDMDPKLKQINVSMLQEQIKQILEARALREKEAMERELEKQKTEME